MKISLNQNSVLHLNLHQKPVTIDNGKLILKIIPREALYYS